LLKPAFFITISLVPELQEREPLAPPQPVLEQVLPELLPSVQLLLQEQELPVCRKEYLLSHLSSHLPDHSMPSVHRWLLLFSDPEVSL
jgi:hypothetical protein